jgi:hypothetical protein
MQEGRKPGDGRGTKRRFRFFSCLPAFLPSSNLTWEASIRNSGIAGALIEHPSNSLYHGMRDNRTDDATAADFHSAGMV